VIAAATKSSTMVKPNREFRRKDIVNILK
jgi:hypothetical protein